MSRQNPNRVPARQLRTLSNRTRMMELYMRGWTLEEIGEDVGLSLSTVSYHIAEIKKTMLKSMRKNFAEWQSEQLMRIDQAERAAWEAWERSMSRQVEERSRHKTSQRPEDPEDMVEVRVKDTSGNVGYMNVILRCIEMRSTLLGLNAPQVMAVVDWRREANQYGMDPEKIHQNLVEHFMNKLADGAEDVFPEE